MIRIIIAEPSSSHYEEALAFIYERYSNRHKCSSYVYPDILAIAYKHERIQGTMGLLVGHEEPYFFEQCEPAHAAERLLCGDSRNELAEITRFTTHQNTPPRAALQLGTALVAHLCAYAQHVRHFGFVGKRSFCSILEALSIQAIVMGKPTFPNITKEEFGTYPDQKNLYVMGFHAPVMA